MTEEQVMHLAVIGLAFYLGYRYAQNKTGATAAASAATAPTDGTTWLETLSGGWAR